MLRGNLGEMSRSINFPSEESLHFIGFKEKGNIILTLFSLQSRVCRRMGFTSLIEVPHEAVQATNPTPITKRHSLFLRVLSKHRLWRSETVKSVSLLASSQIL